MNIAVLKYLYVENKPIGIPDEWPSETIELGNSTELPGINWVLMTEQQLQDHISSFQSAYDTWCGNYNLDELKDNKIKEIDKKTQKIISNGFTYDSHNFSLSIPAQINWSGLVTFQNVLTWPMNITTIDDQEYSLSQANLLYFVSTGTTLITTAIVAGRELKLLVHAATNKTELDVIVDLR